MYLIRVPLLIAAALCAACKTGQYAVVNPFAEEPQSTMAAPQDDPNGWGDGVPRTDETLYGWDGAPVGSPIQSAEPGRVQITDGALGHTLQGADMTGGSRLVLLELYQQTVEEREEFALQVEAQDVALEQAERRFRDLEQRFVALEEGYDLLSAEKTAVEQDLRALAARLTTAQIRRLEAERVWLESAIKWRNQAKANDAANAEIAAAAARGSRP